MPDGALTVTLKRWSVLLGVALINILGAGWLWTLTDLHQERAAHQTTKAEHAEQREQAATAALRLSERNITLTKELTDAINDANTTRQHLAAERASRAAAARAADGRVRDSARALAAKAGQGCATSAAGSTAAAALDLLAGLLDRVAKRTTELAEYADAVADDAQYCRAAYNRAREAVIKD